MNPCVDEQLALGAARERQLRRWLTGGDWRAAPGLPAISLELVKLLDERDRILALQSAYLEARCARCAQEITAEMRARDVEAGGMICADSGRIWCFECAWLADPCPECGNVHDLVATPNAAPATGAETTS